MNRIIRVCAMIGIFLSLGGCVYGPDYYQRPGVVYDDGSAIYSNGGAYPYGYYGYGYAPGYSNYGSYASPWLGFGFYGNYYYGGNYYRGHRGSWHGYNGHRGYRDHGNWRGGRSYDHGGSHRSPHSSGRVRATPPSNSDRPSGRIHRQ